jgi:GGDEF domain-containing protein
LLLLRRRDGPTTCTTQPNSWRTAIAGIRYPVTASVGSPARRCASLDPAERELIDCLVNLADEAMYAAKRAGGNRTCSTRIAHDVTRSD